MIMLELEIIAKYLSCDERLLQEHDRIKLSELVEKIKHDKIKMDDNCEAWDDTKKSRLIESFIMNLPVPSLVFYETRYRKYKVADGRQRIKTVVNYFSNTFALTGLELATKFNGCNYSQLPINIRRLLDRCNLYFVNTVSSGDQNSKEISEFLRAIAERYK
jgi:hypothetical protein